MISRSSRARRQGAALKGLKQRPAGQVEGPKPFWLAVSFLNFGGPIAYFLIGRRK